ncbi:MAG TPA: polysaccharide deacetylase family protein [Thermoanaerobaculia bacterium]|nr:polysaccharide deacetylase family protein [Thermoanaerobaculia bacterium]
MASEPRPQVHPVAPVEGGFGFALTVDVEEWYHTCLVPGYVRPGMRPVLRNELDRLLPDLLETLARTGRSATFFVLGEVAERLPRRIQEIAATGHEVASHGHLHLRASDRLPAEFAADVRRSKAILEDLIGEPVEGYRAPEWSLRGLGNVRLPLVAAAGFRYDSSLAPYLLSGHPGNPRSVSRLVWPGGELLEFPPLYLGSFLRLPAGSIPGRLLPPELLVRAARAHQAKRGLPVFVVHPWELTGEPTPGPLKGLARFVHETGRLHFPPRFRHVLAALPWTTLRAAAGLAPAAREEPTERVRAERARVAV